MTRFQFKPDSNKKQNRTDKRAVEREERADARKTGSRGGPPPGVGARGKTRGPDRGELRAEREALDKARGGKRGPRDAQQEKRGMRGGRVPLQESEAQPKDEFASLLRKTAREMGLFDKLDPEPAPLALLDYDVELELKTTAIRAWWSQNTLPDKPTRVVASPLPRHYRSTSKRRLIWKGAAWRWDFFLERLGGIAKGGIDALEPASHEAVYKRALEKLNEDPYRQLASSLNFLIVRGYPERMVIFNVFRLNAEVVRKARMLADHLARPESEGGAGVAAAHIFFDKTRSDYYLEARVSEGAFRLKRLFGPEFLPVTVDNRRYLLHPTGFFQVNPSILPRVMAEVQNALKPQKTDRLLDLYCGCGLFTLPAAEACGQAYGIEGSPVSIDAARRAAGAAAIRNASFSVGRIDAKSLERMLPPVDGTPEIILLDPPRQGTAPGVIPLLAARNPRRVAYLFCDMNTMPLEVSRWRKMGYMIAKVIPFDMFPGTNNLETLVVLLPDKYGILNRKKPKVDPVDEVEEDLAKKRGQKSGPRAGNSVSRSADKEERNERRKPGSTGGYRQKTGLPSKADARFGKNKPKGNTGLGKAAREDWDDTEDFGFDKPVVHSDWGMPSGIARKDSGSASKKPSGKPFGKSSGDGARPTRSKGAFTPHAGKPRGKSNVPDAGWSHGAPGGKDGGRKDVGGKDLKRSGKPARAREDWEKWDTGSDKARVKKPFHGGKGKGSPGTTKAGAKTDYRRGSVAKRESGQRPPRDSNPNQKRSK